MIGFGGQHECWNRPELTSAAERSGINVQIVALAAEGLSSSIQKTAHQAVQAPHALWDANHQEQESNTTIQGLAEVAKKSSEVVELINDLAEQTYMMALDATIEAARAGKVGKGLMVVASEVKLLVDQTAKATEEIATQIGRMQRVAEDTVGAIGSVVGVTEKIKEITTSIASAVEEQNAATGEISRNVQEAVRGCPSQKLNLGADHADLVPSRRRGRADSMAG